MTKNKKVVSFISFILLILILVSIYLIIYSLDYRSVITPYSQDTYISNIYIGGKTSSEVKEELNDKIDEWKNNFYVELSYQNRSYIICIDDPDIFEFDIAETINNIQNGKKTDYEKGINVINVNFKKENQITDILSQHYDKLKYSDFDTEIISSQLLKKVSFLTQEIYIDLGMAIIEEDVKENMVGEEIQIKTGISEDDSRYNNLQELISEYFSEPIEIKGREQFSFNDFIITQYENYLTNYSLPNIIIDEINNIYQYFFTNDELNRMATGIYQTILSTNFNNIGKSISNTLPSYARKNVESDDGTELLIGEAAVDIEYNYHFELINDKYYITDINFTNIQDQDLTFYNPNYNSFYIQVSLIDEYFVFQLYGLDFVYDYEINFNIDSYDNGYHIKLERVTYYDDIEVKREIIGEDIY